MKIDREKKRVKFDAEDGGSLEVIHTNMGEPYREGIQVALEDGDKFVYLFIESYEAKKLRDLLNRLYPQKQSRDTN